MAQIQTLELSNDSSGYQEPLEDSSTRTIYQEFFHLETTQNSRTLTAAEEFGVLQQLRSKGNNFEVTSGTSEQNKKRHASSVQITHDTNVHKRFRSEKSGMSDQVISTLNEGCINLDSGLDINALYNQILSDNSRLTGNNLEFPITEEYLSTNEIFQVHDNTDNIRNGSYAKNNALNMNISQKDNAAGNIVYPETSEVNNAYSLDDMLGVPGSSFSLDNIAQTNLCTEKFQNRSPLKLQPLVETDQTPSTCLGCNKTISEHLETHDGKNIYRCCQCLFKMENEDCLLTHIYCHEIKFYCNACKLNYSQVGLHGRGQTCDLCEKFFECKYQLEDHCLTHEEFHDTYCRICRNEIYKHYTNREGVKQYTCCFNECKFRSNRISLIKSHLYRHSDLKLFKCEVCEYRFKQFKTARRHLTKKHPLCKLCGKRSVDSYLLYEHICEEHVKKLI